MCFFSCWKSGPTDRKASCRRLGRSALLGAAFAVAYQIVCAGGAWIFQASILAGTGYRLIFWPTIVMMKTFPFLSNGFARLATVFCHGLPKQMDIAQRTPTFACNMIFAILLNLVITAILFIVIGMLAASIMAIRRRKT